MQQIMQISLLMRKAIADQSPPAKKNRHPELTLRLEARPMGPLETHPNCCEAPMRLSNTITTITGGGSDGWDLFIKARKMIS